MTTAQRDALTAVNAMIIYNTTANQMEGYVNSAWMALWTMVLRRTGTSLGD